MSREDDKARRRFAADQGAAAVVEALEVALGSMAGSLTVPVVGCYDRAHLRPYDREVEARFDRYLYDDPDARFCPHVRGCPQWSWYLTDGCPVGCLRCVAGWMAAHSPPGSDEDTRCDICRVGPNPPGTLDERRLIAMVGVPPGRPAPACTVVYLVCAGCMATEGA